MWQNLTRFGVFGLTQALSACGTVQTLAQEKGKVKIRYKDKKSYCQSTSRVYSGVAHNFCQL